MTPDMTPLEVVAVLRLDVETVREYARTRRLKGHVIGRRWRFRPEDVERFRRAGELPDPAPVQLSRTARTLVRQSSHLPGWNKFTRRHATR